MASNVMNACGQRVTATLKKYAALVPSDTRVDMLALRWRRSRRNPRWKSAPTQNCTGVASTSSVHGSRSQAGAQGKISVMLPSTIGTDSTMPTSTRARSRRCAAARAACSRSSAAAQAREHVEQLVDLLLAVAAAPRAHGVGDAGLDVAAKQQFLALLERALHGRDLQQDVDAVRVVLEHALQP